MTKKGAKQKKYSTEFKIGVEVFTFGEDILLLRLTSKLVDLRKEYANSFAQSANGVESNNASTKRKKIRTSHRGSPYLFGRSVEIRTPGLQYPNCDFCVF